MANDEFRESHEDRRSHGLKARHETREARAVRKAVAEEIAVAVEALDLEYGRECYFKADRIASLAREIGSRDPE